MAVGTTKTSGWALFWFLLGFALLGTAGVGGGMISLLAGFVVIVISGFIFKAARKQEAV
ncbi:MAG: hypothetical protein HYS08_07495 [Chlamydiae bacterium]|nr:hypothetical protein [Chlamydiota bacterium]MBI3266340.1 hypothetical protein [Chlamydiota bacterium]